MDPTGKRNKNTGCDNEAILPLLVCLRHLEWLTGAKWPAIKSNNKLPS